MSGANVAAMDETTSPIEQAIDAAGGRSALADRLGVHRSLLSQWLTGHRPVAAKHCIAIEEATGGAVTRYQLRPDVFGESPDSLRRTPAANEGDAASKADGAAAGSLKQARAA